MFYNNNNYQHRQRAKSIKMHKKVLRASALSSFFFSFHHDSHTLTSGQGCLSPGTVLRHMVLDSGEKRTKEEKKNNFPHVMFTIPDYWEKQKERCVQVLCRSCLSFYATAAIVEGRSIKKEIERICELRKKGQKTRKSMLITVCDLLLSKKNRPNWTRGENWVVILLNLDNFRPCWRASARKTTETAYDQVLNISICKQNTKQLNVFISLIESRAYHRVVGNKKRASNNGKAKEN